MTVTGVKPFKVLISNEEVEFLQQRLATARFPDSLTNIAPWEDGTDLDYFKASFSQMTQRGGIIC